MGLTLWGRRNSSTGFHTQSAPLVLLIQITCLELGFHDGGAIFPPNPQPLSGTLYLGIVLGCLPSKPGSSTLIAILEDAEFYL